LEYDNSVFTLFRVFCCITIFASIYFLYWLACCRFEERLSPAWKNHCQFDTGFWWLGRSWAIL